MEAEVGGCLDFDVYEARFTPPVADTKVESKTEEAPKTTRIVVEGVTVRYVEDNRAVRVTVEGELAPSVVEAIVEDAREARSA